MNNFFKNTKGLIFDLDGTLTLTQYLHALAYSKVFKKHGQKYTNEDDKRHSGQGSEKTFTGFFKEHGIKINKQQLQQYSKEKKETYMKLLKQKKIKTVPGIKKFLEKMKKQKMKMIVATGNKLEPSEIILKKVDLLKYFSGMVTNLDVKNPKPAPDIFLKAAKKIGVKPNECIVFEDGLSGIKAAKSGKIKCIALSTANSKSTLLKAGANKIIKNYNQIKI